MSVYSVQEWKNISREESLFNWPSAWGYQNCSYKRTHVWSSSPCEMVSCQGYDNVLIACEFPLLLQNPLRWPYGVWITLVIGPFYWYFMPRKLSNCSIQFMIATGGLGWKLRTRLPSPPHPQPPIFFKFFITFLLHISTKLG